MSSATSLFRPVARLTAVLSVASQPAVAMNLIVGAQDWLMNGVAILLAAE